MTFIPNSDFMLDIARGLVPGHTLVVIRGHNPTQTSASGFVDVSEHGDLTYLTSAETMNIVSTSASDDGSPAGIGLRTLLITGVDGTGAAISETVVLNGTTNVLTSNSYLRINSMEGLTAGSSGWNVGNITATASTAGTIQGEMNAEESLSQGSHYTVPLGKTFYPIQLELNCAKISGGGSPEVEFKEYSRSGGAGAAWLQNFDKKIDTSVTNQLDVVMPFPGGGHPARTDIRIRADTDINNTEVRTRLYGILIDD